MPCPTMGPAAAAAAAPPQYPDEYPPIGAPGITAVSDEHARAAAAAAAAAAPPLDEQVLYLVNALRADPAGFAVRVEEAIQWVDGEYYFKPGADVRRLHEASSAFHEAIAVLQRSPAAPPLRASPILARAAGDHAGDVAFGARSSTGLDGSTPSDRYQRHGFTPTTSAEVLALGTLDVNELVLTLVIDDGVRDRRNRNALLNPAYTLCGIAGIPVTPGADGLRGNTAPAGVVMELAADSSAPAAQTYANTSSGAVAAPTAAAPAVLRASPPRTHRPHGTRCVRGEDSPSPERVGGARSPAVAVSEHGMHDAHTHTHAPPVPPWLQRFDAPHPRSRSPSPTGAQVQTLLGPAVQPQPYGGAGPPAPAPRGPTSMTPSRTGIQRVWDPSVQGFVEKAQVGGDGGGDLQRKIEERLKASRGSGGGASSARSPMSRGDARVMIEHVYRSPTSGAREARGAHSPRDDRDHRRQDAATHLDMMAKITALEQREVERAKIKSARDEVRAVAAAAAAAVAAKDPAPAHAPPPITSEDITRRIREVKAKVFGKAGGGGVDDGGGVPGAVTPKEAVAPRPQPQPQPTLTPGARARVRNLLTSPLYNNAEGVVVGAHLATGGVLFVADACPRQTLLLRRGNLDVLGDGGGAFSPPSAGNAIVDLLEDDGSVGVDHDAEVQQQQHSSSVVGGGDAATPATSAPPSCPSASIPEPTLPSVSGGTGTGNTGAATPIAMFSSRSSNAAAPTAARGVLEAVAKRLPATASPPPSTAGPLGSTCSGGGGNGYPHAGGEVFASSGPATVDAAAHARAVFAPPTPTSPRSVASAMSSVPRVASVAVPSTAASVSAPVSRGSAWQRTHSPDYTAPTAADEVVLPIPGGAAGQAQTQGERQGLPTTPMQRGQTRGGPLSVSREGGPAPGTPTPILAAVANTLPPTSMPPPGAAVGVGLGRSPQSVPGVIMRSPSDSVDPGVPAAEVSPRPPPQHIAFDRHEAGGPAAVAPALVDALTRLEAAAEDVRRAGGRLPPGVAALSPRTARAPADEPQLPPAHVHPDPHDRTRIATPMSVGMEDVLPHVPQHVLDAHERTAAESTRVADAAGVSHPEPTRPAAPGLLLERRFGAHDEVILTAPRDCERFQLHTGDGAYADLEGVYNLVKPEKGIRVYRQAGGPGWVYENSLKVWTLTDNAEHIMTDKGFIASKKAHNGLPPSAVPAGGWHALTHEDGWRTDPTVRAYSLPAAYLHNAAEYPVLVQFAVRNAGSFLPGHFAVTLLQDPSPGNRHTTLLTARIGAKETVPFVNGYIGEATLIDGTVEPDPLGYGGPARGSRPSVAHGGSVGAISAVQDPHPRSRSRSLSPHAARTNPPSPRPPAPTDLRLQHALDYEAAAAREHEQQWRALRDQFG